MKDDGSEMALSDNYVFDPSVPEFTSLTTTNGPPDVYGHTALVLNDGRLVVFGGYSQSRGELLPMNYVWVLDPSQSSLSWSLLSVSTSSLPSGRRGFASTVVEGGQILIHGGADATLENVYDDAWILDTSVNPMTWSSISSISSTLGYRYDHFAVAYGSEVIFGFGECIYICTHARLHIHSWFDFGLLNIIQFRVQQVRPSLSCFIDIPVCQ
jgi:N-acetylneuraminic acid mutarotase